MPNVTGNKRRVGRNGKPVKPSPHVSRCVACEGTGWDSHAKYTCVPCNGQGWKVVFRDRA